MVIIIIRYTWNHMIACKLLALVKKTWHFLTVLKTDIIK